MKHRLPRRVCFLSIGFSTFFLLLLNFPVFKQKITVYVTSFFLSEWFGKSVFLCFFFFKVCELYFLFQNGFSMFFGLSCWYDLCFIQYFIQFFILYTILWSTRIWIGITNLFCMFVVEFSGLVWHIYWQNISTPYSRDTFCNFEF